VLTGHGVARQIVTVVKSLPFSWAHSVIKADGCYYDSMGEFSTDIYRARARIHPKVELKITYTS
jgi:hypothetical protein